MGRLVLGIVLGLILAPLVVLGWFKWGNPPVAVADSPLPFERQIVHVPMRARIDRQMVKDPPIQPDEQTFIAGARIYRDQCASCHGVHGKPSDFAAHMYPRAPQLWQAHRNGKVVGVSDDPPGETYWKVSNGIRLTGMPAFNKILNETQMWQVSLLLANADKPLPPDAISTLEQASQQPLAIPAAPAAKK
jgi:thiosulfate dehydrogenase